MPNILSSCRDLSPTIFLACRCYPLRIRRLRRRCKRRRRRGRRQRTAPHRYCHRHRLPRHRRGRRLRIRRQQRQWAPPPWRTCLPSPIWSRELSGARSCRRPLPREASPAGTCKTGSCKRESRAVMSRREGSGNRSGSGSGAPRCLRVVIVLACPSASLLAQLVPLVGVLRCLCWLLQLLLCERSWVSRFCHETWGGGSLSFALIRFITFFFLPSFCLFVPPSFCLFFPAGLPGRRGCPAGPSECTQPRACSFLLEGGGCLGLPRAHAGTNAPCFHLVRTLFRVAYICSLHRIEERLRCSPVRHLRL